MNDASRYDALLDAGREPAPPCPVCTGDEDAEPCGEDCDRIMKMARARSIVRNMYGRARTALYMARVYRSEGPEGARRSAECLQQARVYRDAARVIRRTAA